MTHRSAAAILITAISLALPALSLAGTLDQIKKSGEIRIGYRTDAPPLAFNDSAGQPAGYSVDLCKRIATAVKDDLKLADLKVTFVPLTSADRIDAVVNNKADIECGATTVTLSREEKVDFTLMTFVTGGSLLSLGESAVNALSDTAGKSIAVVKGTTSETALKNALTKNLIDAKVTTVASREEGMKQLDAKQVAAFASDQVVLIGQIIQSADPKKYALARELFSYEPYAFVVRRNDSAFLLVANRALAQTYRTGQIEQVYGKWFGQAGIKPSPVLAAMYALQSLPE
ncbi:MAG TPA: amino acid ABC transporter substrate-binding protein [Steroidobacteraceae bacterium]|nr:amino acid ABC transporter substrate-binding protein [Steroidobacteraceae bacterium]